MMKINGITYGYELFKLKIAFLLDKYESRKKDYLSVH